MTMLLTGRAQSTLLNQIHHADLFTLCDWLYEAGIRVDMILADLPYASLEIGWDKLIPVAQMWQRFNRIISPTGAIVLTSKQPFSSLLLTSNMQMYRYSWYWEKSRGANVAQVAYRPLAVIEEVLVFSHAPAVWSNKATINYYPQMTPREKTRINTHKPHHAKIVNNSAGSPMRNPERGIGVVEYEERMPRSLITIADDPDRGLHPTQKPVALFEYLIRTYTRAGEIVLDPTCGSGTTALAARNTQRQYVCGDSSAKYVQVARNRLAQPYTLPLFAEATA